MSLWYWSRDKWLEALLDRFDIGTSVFLVCPGPSASECQQYNMRGSGRLVVAMNRAYPLAVQHPDMWIGMDMPACHDRSLWWEPFPKITRWDWREECSLGNLIKFAPSVYFVETDDKAHPNEMFRRLSGKTKFCWNWNTFEGALHILFWLGTRKLYLVGCDMGGKSDYCGTEGTLVLTEEQRLGNRELYQQQVGRLEVLTTEARHRGIDIQSCTADSPINDFLSYIPLGKALEICEKSVPKDRSAPLLHVRDAELCLWKHPDPKPGRQVVVALDSGQEWLLEWWYDNYRKHNDYPVLFVDLGMSEAGCLFCQKKGKCVPLPKRSSWPRLGNWYTKPFAILQGEMEELLWLDMDCEVVDDLGPFFDLSVGRKIGIREATSYVYPAIPGVVRDYNSGLISLRHGDPMIQGWAERMFSWVEKGGFTDEPPLSLELSLNHAGRVIAVPHGWLASPTSMVPSARPVYSNVKVKHWLGPDGKAKIREMVGPADVSQTLPTAYGGQSLDSWTVSDEERKIICDCILGQVEQLGSVHVVEIGVSRGVTATAILTDLVRENVDFVYVGIDPMTWRRPEIPIKLYSPGKVHLLPMMSKDALSITKDLCGGRLDFVVIDGCHCKECVELDWSLYSKLVPVGGVVAFHDISHSDSYVAPHDGFGTCSVWKQVKEDPDWEVLIESFAGDGLGMLRRRTKKG